MMSLSQSHPSDVLNDAEEKRISDLVKEYMRQWESGRRPNRRELLARHRDIAAALTPYLDGLDAIYDAGLTRRTLSYEVPVDPTDSSVTFPEPLGDFRIVREIGRGGMGSVYEAVQLSLGRRVALKILPLAAALDDRNLRRFKTEAQAAALLHHSNIVPVYAVGCERGVHFYAMQLIEGHSLAHIIKQLRGRPGGPLSTPDLRPWLPRSNAQSTADHPAQSPGEQKSAMADPQTAQAASTEQSVPGFADELTTMHDAGRRNYYRTAARLIRDAARALEHAHQSGVIHRDIKPANLLVDRTGNLWITDFGLAQFHEEIGPTRTGDLLGTLQYMSPEQASGQRVVLDARTDVYSLGATLYELLALRPMFDGENRQAILRQISNEDPRPLRQIEPTAPPELETIVMKATAKAAVDRYQTAQAFADDLDSFLQDRPIQARRPTLIERGRKWMRRHPWAVGTAVSVLALAAVGLGIHNSLLAVEQARTRQALEQESERAEEAEKAFRQAREAVDLLVQVAEDELRNQPLLVNVRRKLLETALTYYQDFLDDDSPTAKTAQAGVAAARSRVRRILADLATLQGAHRLRLLREPSIQQELALTEEQRAQVTELTGQRPPMWRGQRPGRGGPAGKRSPPPDRSENVDGRRLNLIDWLRQQEERLTAVLTPAQANRLDQVVRQLEGPHTFTQPEIIEKLKLTKFQREFMARIENELLGQLLADLSSGRSVDADRLREVAKRSTERCIRLLTEEQTKIWEELTGPPLSTEPPWVLVPPPMTGFGRPPGPPPGLPGFPGSPGSQSAPRGKASGQSPPGG